MTPALLRPDGLLSGAALVRRAKRFLARHPPLERLARFVLNRPAPAPLPRVEPLPGSWPARYRADPPQRYTQNWHRYLAQGGALRPLDLVEKYVAGNQDNRADMARFFLFCLVCDQMEKEGLRGDLAELGVYKGNTAALLAWLARRIGTTAYLFDTFGGFAPGDLRGIDADKRMQFADTSLAAVRALVGEANVRFVVGHFPATAAAIPEGCRFALVHLDCDLYEPLRAALAYFYPRMLPGGFLLMHDYSSLHWNGAERAIDEFFADKAEYIIPVPDGAGTVIVRKSRLPEVAEDFSPSACATGFTHNR